MNYSITRWEIQNLIEDIGEDVASFYVFIQLNNDMELSMPIIIPFDHLVERHISKMAPNEYAYIQTIRNTIGGYGPKHTKMFEILNSEDYNFLQHFQLYITEKMAMEHKEYCDRIAKRTPQQQEEIEETIEDLESNFDKEAVMKSYEFLEYLDNAIHQATVKFYPELFERDKETIEAYQDALVRTVTRFGAEIDELL